MIRVYDNISGEQVVCETWKDAENESKIRANHHSNTFYGKRYIHYGVKTIVTIDKKHNCITISRRKEK